MILCHQQLSDMRLYPFDHPGHCLSLCPMVTHGVHSSKHHGHFQGRKMQGDTYSPDTISLLSPGDHPAWSRWIAGTPTAFFTEPIAHPFCGVLKVPHWDAYIAPARFRFCGGGRRTWLLSRNATEPWKSVTPGMFVTPLLPVIFGCSSPLFVYSP